MICGSRVQPSLLGEKRHERAAEIEPNEKHEEFFLTYIPFVFINVNSGTHRPEQPLSHVFSQMTFDIGVRSGK